MVLIGNVVQKQESLLLYSLNNVNMFALCMDTFNVYILQKIVLPLSHFSVLFQPDASLFFS